MEAICFWFLALVTVAGGLTIIFHRHPVACALALAGLSLALAALFLTLEAFFLAAVQVIVYTGAVVVLFLFILMLADIKSEAGEKASRFRRAVSSMLGLSLCGTFALVFIRFQAGKAILSWSTTPVLSRVEGLGQLLFNEYALPFLAVAVLLLTSIIGVMTLAKKDESTH